MLLVSTGWVIYVQCMRLDGGFIRSAGLEKLPLSIFIIRKYKGLHEVIIKLKIYRNIINDLDIIFNSGAD